MPTISETLSAAVKHHQSGRRAQAAALYREILRVSPQNPDALHLLGVIGNETGDQQMAVEKIRQAISLRPDIPEFHSNLGNALQAQGQYAAAVASYRTAIQLSPKYATAHNNLGNALKAMGQLEEGIVCYRTALNLQPNYPGALCNLASALLDKRETDEAIAALRRALALSPNLPEAYNNLGNAFQAQGKTAEAEAAYRRALELRPDYAAVQNNLGGLMQSSDRIDEALACFREAVRIQPNYPDAHANLGSVLLHYGEVDAAIESFCTALQQNDSLAGPYHELALLARQGDYEFTAQQVSRMQALLADHSISQDRASLLHFALARVREQQQDYGAAFAHFELGNELRKEHLKQRKIQVDHVKYLQVIDDLIAVLDEDYFQRVATFGILTDVPVFIIGMPRSGTTLVEQILASHPEVYGAGELKQVANIASGMKSRLASADNYPRCLPLVDGPTVRELAESHLAFLRERGGTASRIVDKMPLNYNHLGLIATLFPRAYVIHCRRDPIDTCFSGFTQYAIPTSLDEIATCYQQYERLMSHWRTVLPIKMYEVQYEELVANQQEQTRNMIEFCDLSWDERCLDFHQTKRNVQTPSKLDVRRPIYSTAVRSWKKYEAYLQPLIDRFGIEEQQAS